CSTPSTPRCAPGPRPGRSAKDEQDQRAERDAVVAERRKAPLPQVLEERGDHRPGDQERDDEADDEVERRDLTGQLVTPLVGLVDRRRSERRQGQEEGELGRGRGGEARQ